MFERNNINVLTELGYEIHCAANFEDASPKLDELTIIRHHFDIQRSPFSLKNIKAFFQLYSLMKQVRFDLVHCHAPMGGVIGRLCAYLTESGPVFYTAHGFHFYHGASLINWLLYYPIERFLARFTDVLITINQEDYHRARKFKVGKVSYLPGIGIDTSKFKNVMVDVAEKRKEIGLPEEALVILSVGELIKRKNHETVIKAMAKVKSSNLYYVVCGRGKLEKNLKTLAWKLGVSGKVKFLGFRTDIAEICKAVDIFAFLSIQEGLPVALMEAMASGLPVICSAIRGNVDLIENCKGGYLIEPDDIYGFADAIAKLWEAREVRIAMGVYNSEIVNNNDVSKIKPEMKKIYSNAIAELSCPFVTDPRSSND